MEQKCSALRKRPQRCLCRVDRRQWRAAARVGPPRRRLAGASCTTYSSTIASRRTKMFASGPPTSLIYDPPLEKQDASLELHLTSREEDTPYEGLRRRRYPERGPGRPRWKRQNAARLRNALRGRC